MKRTPAFLLDGIDPERFYRYLERKGYLRADEGDFVVFARGTTDWVATCESEGVVIIPRNRSLEDSLANYHQKKLKGVKI